VTTKVDSPKDLLPFGWERGQGPADTAERETLFRFPAADDPAPGTRRVLAMSLYASVLGLGGVGVGGRGLVSVIGGVPGWYVPLLAFLGLFSVTLVIGGFLSIHRPMLPYLLLAAAAVPLSGAALLAVSH
jgi:hypothetical protein